VRRDGSRSIRLSTIVRLFTNELPKHHRANIGHWEEPIDQYLRNFTWNKVKYRSERSIGELIEVLHKVRSMCLSLGRLPLCHKNLKPTVSRK